MGNTAERSGQPNMAAEAEDECESSDEAGEEEVFVKPYFLVMWEDWGLMKYTINNYRVHDKNHIHGHGFG